MQSEKGDMAGPEIAIANSRRSLRAIARHSLAVLLATTALGVVVAHAVDATWVGGNGLDPNEWNEPANWSGAATPDGITTLVNDNGIVFIGELLFTGAPNAQAYTVNIDNPFLVVNAAGIINNSTNTQTFNITSGNSLVFQGGGSASGGTGTVQFNNTSGG